MLRTCATIIVPKDIFTEEEFLNRDEESIVHRATEMLGMNESNKLRFKSLFEVYRFLNEGVFFIDRGADKDGSEMYTDEVSDDFLCENAAMLCHFMEMVLGTIAMMDIDEYRKECRTMDDLAVHLNGYDIDAVCENITQRAYEERADVNDELVDGEGEHAADHYNTFTVLHECVIAIILRRASDYLAHYLDIFDRFAGTGTENDDTHIVRWDHHGRDALRFVIER